MYSLPYFTEKDRAAMIAFMHQHPFALFTGSDVHHQPVATQIPFLIREEGERIFLKGHIMRQTDHHKAFMANPHALVVFTGPHTYVSASWYSNPQQGSTWNYMSVHVKGTVRFLEHAELLEVLEQTTSLFENNSESPSLMEKLPQEYIDRLTKAIVAIEIEVLQMDGVFKLSQNRDKESYLNIIKKLKEGDTDAKKIAAEMEVRQAWGRG
ncbi:MAG: FMN-binding negative transcriptional regulator [Chitinophagaceae bacterium]